MSAIVINIIIANATQSIPALIIYVPVSIMFLLENHRQDLILFFVVKSQRKLLAENKQMSDDMPLSAFMNGVETVKNQLESIHDLRETHNQKEDILNSFDDRAHMSM
eukprot:gene38143-47084_t